MGFTALNEEPKSGFVPLDDSKGGFTPIEAIRSAQEDLPETWNVAGFDTGIAMHPKTAAFMVNAGGKMMGSIRGIRQIIDRHMNPPERDLSSLITGRDKKPVDVEADNQAALNRLEQDSNVGGYATAGGVIGSLADPVTLALPVIKGGSLLNMAKSGLVGGGVAGALNPLAEGDSRTVNAVTSAAAGATLAPVLGTVARRLGTGQWAPFREPVAAPSNPERLLLEYKPTPPEPLIVDPKGNVGTEAQIFREKYRPQSAVPEGVDPNAGQLLSTTDAMALKRAVPPTDVQDTRAAVDAYLNGAPLKPYPADSLKSQIVGMKAEIGADEKGGRVVVDMVNADRAPGMGDVIDKTKWTGQRWWFDRPDKLSASEAKNAIDKYAAGETLGKRQQRFIDYVGEELKMRDAATERGGFGPAANEALSDDAARAAYGPGAGGAINPQLLAKMGGATVGAVTGAATADEGASPQEIAARALLGFGAGWQLAKFGAGRIGAVRPGAPQVGSISGVKAPAEPINVIGDAAEPLFKQEVSPAITKKLTALAGDFFEQNKGLRNPKVLISDDVKANIVNGNISVEFAAQHGVTPVELATIARDTVKDAATTMAHYSRLARDLNLQLSPEERALFGDAAKSMEDSAYIRPFWKKLQDAWRGSLVVQPATAVRNYATQVGRVGLDVLQAPIDHWLQKLTGREVTVQPLDGFEELLSLFQRNKESVDKVLAAFPKQKERLFQSYMSEVQQAVRGPNPTTGDQAWAKVEDTIGMLNILNRTQENVVRRGIFQATLAQEMRNRGHDLADIIKNNKLGVIPEDAIKKSIEQSLNKTFSESPAFGTIWQKGIDFVNAVPTLNLAVPFPRFMFNAMRFQYQYSPMGVLSYLSPAERTAFANGDTSKMSKAIIGTGLFGAAMLMRNSDHAGEKWYEYTKDNGDVVDLRPFNPFASYLFAADVLKKTKDGTLYKLTGNDIAQGLLSTNMRAGTGLYLLDNALNLMSKSGDDKKFMTKAAEFTGDFLSGFLTPLNVFRDAYDQMTEGDAIQRDTRQEFLGPMKSRIPGVSQTLPEAQQPTREGPRVTVNPLLRQVTGLNESGPKNALEKELDRLGFDRREVLASTGDHELDSEYSRVMGMASERLLVPMVESEKFQGLKDSVKGVILHEALTDISHEVKSGINSGLPPEKQLKLEIKKQSPRLRYLLEEFGVKP